MANKHSVSTCSVWWTYRTGLEAVDLADAELGADQDHGLQVGLLWKDTAHCQLYCDLPYRCEAGKSSLRLASVRYELSSSARQSVKLSIGGQIIHRRLLSAGSCCPLTLAVITYCHRLSSVRHRQALAAYTAALSDGTCRPVPGVTRNLQSRAASPRWLPPTSRRFQRTCPVSWDAAFLPAPDWRSVVET